MVLTNEEKLQHAQTRKEEGNEAFKQGRVKDGMLTEFHFERAFQLSLSAFTYWKCLPFPLSP